MELARQDVAPTAVAALDSSLPVNNSAPMVEPSLEPSATDEPKNEPGQLSMMERLGRLLAATPHPATTNNDGEGDGSPTEAKRRKRTGSD